MAIKNSWSSGEVLTAADLTDTMNGVYINAQTGNYTFGTADGFVTLSNASGGTATIPANATAAFNTGAVIGVMNAGTAGSFTIGTAAGVTLNAVSGTTTLAPLESATLVKLGTNTWQLSKGGGAGLYLITTQSFSAAASVSVNNCFSATYENYVYIGHVACTTLAQVKLRLRISSTDNSTAGNYLWGGAYTRWVTSATVTGEHSSTTETSFPLTDADGNFSFFEGKLFSPFASRLTGFTNVQAYNAGGSLNDGYWEAFAGSMTVTTSYTGFTIFPSSGNISGSISIYGLRNS